MFSWAKRGTGGGGGGWGRGGRARAMAGGRQELWQGRLASLLLLWGVGGEGKEGRGGEGGRGEGGAGDKDPDFPFHPSSFPLHLPLSSYM